MRQLTGSISLPQLSKGTQVGNFVVKTSLGSSTSEIEYAGVNLQERFKSNSSDLIGSLMWSWLLCECVLRSCRVIWSCRGPLASLTCIQEEHKEEMNKLEHKLTVLETPTKSLPTDIKTNISDPWPRCARYYNQLRPLNKMSGAVLYYIWGSELL